MSFGLDANERSYSVMEGNAPRATRLGLVAATLRIEMMNRFSLLLPYDDYEQFRKSDRAKALASTLADKIYKYGYRMHIYHYKHMEN